MNGSAASGRPESELRNYGLEWLSAHLSLGDCLDRLRELFSSDQWLGIRVPGDNYFYDGYLGDLGQAVDALVPAADHCDITTGAILDAVRLGWVRATVLSRTAAPDRLLIGIARQRLWPVQRLAAHIGRLPTASKRIVALAHVLEFGALEPVEREVLEKAGRDALQVGKTAPSLKALTALARVASPAMKEHLGGLMSAALDRSEPFDAISAQTADNNVDETEFTIDDAIDALSFLPDASRNTHVARLLTRVAELALSAANRAEDHVRPAPRHPRDQLLALIGDAPKVRAELLKDKPITDKGLMEGIWAASRKGTEQALGRGRRGRQLVALAPHVASHSNARTLLDRVCGVIEATEGSDSDLIQTIVDAYARELDVEQARRVLSRLGRLSPEAFHRCSAAFLARVQPAVGGALAGMPELDAALRHLMQTETDAVPTDDSAESGLIKALGRQDRAHRTNTLRPLTPAEIEWQRSQGPDSDPLAFEFFTLSERRERWLQQAMKRGEREAPTPGESDQEPSVDPPAERDPLVGMLQTMAGPLALCKLLTGFSQILSPADQDRFIEGWLTKHFHATEYPFQFYLLCSIPKQAPSDANDVELQQSVRRVQGWFLRLLIRTAYESGEPIAAAWDGLPRAGIESAVLGPALDYALQLPHFVQRSMLLFAMYGDCEPSRPMLEALRLLAPHLEDEDFDRAFRRVMGLTDPEARRLGLEILGPYLRRDQLNSVMRSSESLHGLRVPYGTLMALNPGDGFLPQSLERWRERAARFAASGAELAQGLLHSWKPDNEAAAEALIYRCEQALRNRDPNVRLDCLVTLVAGWPANTPLPDRLIDLALELPAVNETNTFSWRAYILTSLIDRAPDTAMERIWNACQDLPRRLRIGDSQLWGWNWSYEYPYALVLGALAERVPGHLLPDVFREAETFFWAAREDICERLAARADPALAAEIFQSTVRRLRKYLTEDVTPERLLAAEGSASLDKPSTFRTAREQASCNIIAALAAQLGDEDFRAALELCTTFTNDGPRCWLPAQLLKLERQIDRELLLKVLRPAYLAALIYISADPGRADVLLDLLPAVRREIAAASAPLRDLVSRHYPGKVGVLLNQEEVERLPPEDRARYWELLSMSDQLREVAPDIDPITLMQNLEVEGLTETQRRSILEILHLGPLIGSNLENTLEFAIFQNPPSRRTEALPLLQKNLPDGEFRRLITRHFDDVCGLLLNGIGDGLELLAAMAKFLPVELHPKYVETVLAAEFLRGPTADEQELFLRSGLGHFAGHRDAPGARGKDHGVGLLLKKKFDADVREIRDRALLGARGGALLALAPYVQPSFRPDFVRAALRLPANEQCLLLASFVADGSEEERRMILGHVAAADSPVLRIYVPSAASKFLSEGMRKQLASGMIAASEELEHSESSVTGLLISAGMVDDPHPVYERCLELLSATGESETMVGSLVVLLQLAEKDPPIAEECVRRLLCFQGSQFRLQAIVAIGRISEERNRGLRSRSDVLRAGVRLLIESANSGREVFADHLVKLAPILGFSEELDRWNSLTPFFVTVEEQWKWL